MEKQDFEQMVKQLGIQIETDIIFMFPELEVHERTLLLQKYKRAGCNLFKFFEGLTDERKQQFIEFLDNPEQRNSRRNQQGQPTQSILNKKRTTLSGIHEPAGNSPDWKMNH